MKNDARGHTQRENRAPGSPKVNLRCQECAKGRQKWIKTEPKGTQSEPRDTKKKPKGCQKCANGRQRAPKGSLKWAKGRPKCIQKSIFGKGYENGSKKIAGPGIRRTILGAIFHQKTMKKSMRKSMPKKSWNFMKIRCENEANFKCVLRQAFMKKIYFSKRVKSF